MRWQKLNTTFDADPNSPMPKVTITGDQVTVEFYLNHYIWDDVQPGEKAMLTFSGTYMYRLGSTNDEGFYRGQCRFSGTGIAWGDFYELDESLWQQSFPSDRIVLGVPGVLTAGLKHFLYYFRDETFECVAQGYEFRRIGRAM
jgi:hypothetical protein